MWTPRKKELHTFYEIEKYLNDVDNFHDYRLGNCEYNSVNSTANIFIETEHKTEMSSTEGYVWNFEIKEIKTFSMSIDVLIGTWIDEIIVKNESKIIFSFANGYISISSSKITLGIPSM